MWEALEALRVLSTDSVDAEGPDQWLTKSLSLAIIRLFISWFWSSSACESAVQQPENWWTWGFCQPFVRTTREILWWGGWEADIFDLKHVNRIFGHCDNPLTAFLSGLWVWHLLLFSAQILAWKWERRSTGLLQCPKILLTCFRARTSDEKQSSIESND